MVRKKQQHIGKTQLLELQQGFDLEIQAE